MNDSTKRRGPRSRTKREIKLIDRYTFDNCNFRSYIMTKNSNSYLESPETTKLGKYYHFEFRLYPINPDSDRPHFNYHLDRLLDQYVPFNFDELKNINCNYVIVMSGHVYLNKEGDKYYLCNAGWGDRWHRKEGKTYSLDYDIGHYLTKQVFEGLIKDIENFHQQVRLLES